jgi:two-component system, cell cycle sensor histidine kinase and response regulator CckA
LRNLWRASRPRSTPPVGTGLQPYALAVLTTGAAVLLTQSTWPFFAGAPFAPLFAAVAATTHFGSGSAGLLAVLLGVIGAPLAFPTVGPVPWTPYTLIGFVPVALIGSRIIAARNQAVAALRASEAQLRATWEHATLGAALLDRLGRVERVNPALERLLGYSGTTSVGTAFSTFSAPDEMEADRERFAGFLAGADDFYQRDQRYRRQDGTLFWGRVTVSVVRGAHGARTGALAVLEDVTAQRQAQADLQASEDRLRRAQKMEAVGQLVAGVAHNFNNLLTVTMGYTEILLDPRRDQDQDRAAIEEIRKATDRGAALTRQLLAFARKHDARVARIDLNGTIAGLREMLTRVIREDIALTIDVEPGALAVMIDPHDLEQVVFNLVINARDALPDGGAVHIDVTRTAIDAANSPADVAVPPGEYVRLRVRDNGIGMPPDVQAHLFEPFFTTKDVGEGTGLGLAFVHGIARHGHGFVTVETAPAKGTTVSVYWPRAPHAAIEPAVEPATTTARDRPAATILLVEDEAAVRELTAQMLSRAGYRVLSAATPGEACALFDEHQAGIDLLITDVVMPEMHGPALAERLVAKRPDLRVLFVSGYSDAMPASATANHRVTFLGKPFAPARLMETVAELLMAGAT